MKKKKKSGSIAIPFLLTFLISLIIIGGIAMFIYDKIDRDNSSLITMNNEGESISDNNSNTIMLVLDLSKTINQNDDSDDEYSDDESSDNNEDSDSNSDSDSDEDSSEDDEDFNEDDEDFEDDEDEDDKENKKKAEKKPYTFLLMRSMPVHKQILFIGLPENMHVGEKNLSLTETYKKGGGMELKSAASYSLGITIDRYMVFESESFQKTCNILGGVEFAVPGNIEGIKSTGSLQYLAPDQIEKIISSGGFGGNELQRVSTAAALITSMTNQTNGERIADNLDNTFDFLVNANDTDISALDYQQEKYAMKFLMKYTDPTEDDTTSTRAKFITPTGTQTSDAFILDSSFSDEISEYFKIETTEATKNSDLQPMMPETGENSHE